MCRNPRTRSLRDLHIWELSAVVEPLHVRPCFPCTRLSRRTSSKQLSVCRSLP